MSPAAVLDAVRLQNVQFAAGSIGTSRRFPVSRSAPRSTTEGRFTTPGAVREHPAAHRSEWHVREAEGCGARWSSGQSQYGFETRVGDTPIAGFAHPAAAGCKCAASDEGRAGPKCAELQPSFPPGVTWFTPFDSTTFIQVAIREVLITLVAAVVLVFIVMLVFLQNFRATLIPTLVVPVALLGTMVGIYAVGFSINQLTLFAMVLAIGIVVDDAIVVVEAVERIMREEHLCAQRGDAQGDGPDHRRDRRHHAGAGRRLHSQCHADRQHRRDLPAVRPHHRAVHGFLGLSRAELHAGAVRDAAASRAPARQLPVQLVQSRL